MNDRPDPHPDALTELLADHDAGLPVDPSVLTDPRARSVLDALAATRAELAAVAREPVPPEFAARWHAALTEPTRVDRSDTPSSPIERDPLPRGAGPNGATTAAGPTPQAAGDVGSPGCDPPDGTAIRPGPAGRPVLTPGPARRRDPASPGPREPGRTRRRRTHRPAVVAGLMLAVVLVVAGVVGVRNRPPSVTAAQLGGIARASLGVHEAGPFADPVRREACLGAVGPSGLAPDAELAGGRSVVFDGHPGVLLLLITGRLATFHVVVVTPDCAALLAETVIGP